MKDLIAKIGRFCENHVEKIVLVIAGAICVWLFFTRVIFSPNVVPLQGKNFTPGQIDRYVYEQKAQELSAELQRQRTGKSKVYKSRLTGAIDPCDAVIADVIRRPLPRGFVGLFESPLDFIDAAAVPKAARVSSARYAESSRKYRLPLIPDVTDVAVNHIRAAAYVPIREITAQAAYDTATSEAGDVDLVTVEARFNTTELYRRFRASFNGVDVQREEWRDPCLADPTFAAVQIQRQELLEDGTWSDWRAIPRSRVESNRELFTVTEKVEDLPPGGVDVRMMLFDRKDVALSLLQPESYQIASAEEEWFPPSLYGKFKDLQKRVEAEDRKEQREQDRGQSDRTVDNRGGLRGGAGGAQTSTSRSGRLRPQTGAGGGDTGLRGARGARGGQTGDPMMTGGGRGGRRGGPEDMYGDMYGMQGAGADGRRKPTTDEVYFDLREELLTYRSDLSKSAKPVLVWAFDDTAEPGKIYQYRLRVGVFNPVAGTGQLVDRDMDKKDQVILWSRFSEVTRPVSIPRMVYLFAKNVQDKTKTATVEVARYKLGYWRTEDFQVRPGESIGKSVEPRETERETRREREKRLAMMGQMGGGGRISDPRGDLMADPAYMGMLNPEEANRPKVVDYTTGKVLVDLVVVNDWGDAANLRPRTYHDMLYTSDGTSIEHMPVSMTNWPRDMSEAYQAIQTEKRREPKPFRSFSKSSRGRGDMMDPYGGGGGMYDDMYNMGGGGGPYGR
jgi:hypothetical protein